MTANIELIEETFINAKNNPNLIGVDILKQYLSQAGIEADDSGCVSSIATLSNEFDIADIRVNNIKLNARVIVGSHFPQLWIPKSHFNSKIFAEIYVGIKINNEFNNAEIIGFIETSTINNPQENKHYYIIDSTKLKPIEELNNVISSIQPRERITANYHHDKAQELIIKYFDGEASIEDKEFLVKHLDSCREFANNIALLSKFEKISKETANHKNYLDDHTLKLFVGDFPAQPDEITLEINDNEENTNAQILEELMNQSEFAPDVEMIAQNDEPENVLEIISDDNKGIDLLEELEKQDILDNKLIADKDTDPKLIEENTEPEILKEVNNIDSLELDNSELDILQDSLNDIPEIKIQEIEQPENIDENFQLTDLSEAQNIDDLLLNESEELKEEASEENGSDMSDLLDIVNTLESPNNDQNATPDEIKEVKTEKNIEICNQDELTFEELPIEELQEETSDEENPLDLIDQINELAGEPDNSEPSIETPEEVQPEEVNEEELILFEESNDFNIEDDNDMLELVEDSVEEVIEYESEAVESIEAPIDEPIQETTTFTEKTIEKVEEETTTNSNNNDNEIYLDTLNIPDEYKDVTDPEVLKLLLSDDDGLDNLNSFDTAENHEDIHSEIPEEYQNVQPGAIQIEKRSSGSLKVAVTAATIGILAAGAFVAVKNPELTNMAVSKVQNLVAEKLGHKEAASMPEKELQPINTKVKAEKNDKAVNKTTKKAEDKTTEKFAKATKQKVISKQKVNTPKTKPAIAAKKSAATNKHTKVTLPKSKSINDALARAFTSEHNAVRISKVSWEVGQSLVSDQEFKKFLILSGQAIKMDLSQELLLVNDRVYSEQIKVKLIFNKNGNLTESEIQKSSGSKQIDSVVLQTIKNTLKYLKMPAINTEKRIITTSFVINL